MTVEALHQIVFRPEFAALMLLVGFYTGVFYGRNTE